jgi:hypothetical protein
VSTSISGPPSVKVSRRWTPDVGRQRSRRFSQLYVMRADGSRIRRLIHNVVPDLFPDWQAVTP